MIMLQKPDFWNVQITHSLSFPTSDSKYDYVHQHPELWELLNLTLNCKWSTFTATQLLFYQLYLFCKRILVLNMGQKPSRGWLQCCLSVYRLQNKVHVIIDLLSISLLRLITQLACQILTIYISFLKILRGDFVFCIRWGVRNVFVVAYILLKVLISFDYSQQIVGFLFNLHVSRNNDAILKQAGREMRILKTKMK